MAARQFLSFRGKVNSSIRTMTAMVTGRQRAFIPYFYIHMTLLKAYTIHEKPIYIFICMYVCSSSSRNGGKNLQETFFSLRAKKRFQKAFQAFARMQDVGSKIK